MSSKKITGKILFIFDKINLILTYFCGVLLALITLSVCAEVIVRKFFNYSIIGVVEGSEYALVFITFLSASWVLKRDAHVKVDIVLSWLAPGTRRILNTATSIFGAILCMFIAYRSAVVIWDLWQRNLHAVKALELPMAPLHLSIFLGSVMLSLGFLRRVYVYLVEREDTAETE